MISMHKKGQTLPKAFFHVANFEFYLSLDPKKSSIIVQLNKYETDQYFLQNIQISNNCLIIYAFCKSCEREIVFVLICKTGRTIPGSQLLQKTRIIKQTDILLWKIWRKYESVLYSFSCRTKIVRDGNL